jgi:hypothetical protein
MKGSVIAPALGPKSRRSRLAALDGRTQEANLLRRTRQELLAHCGANLSVVQRSLCERAAVLTLYVSQFDARALRKGGLSLHDSREYLACSNALSRSLRQLGLKGSGDVSRDRGIGFADALHRIAAEQDKAAVP